MPENREILILGASYGSLLAIKLALAGHNTTMVCLPDEAELINRDGVRVRMPVKGGGGELVELHSAAAPGTVLATSAVDADPAKYDLIGLAMQEPQYRAKEVRGLLGRVAASRRPCMSIMNMPPLPYLMRIPGLDSDALSGCYADASVWSGFDPGKVTLCSPDPQAFRPPEEPVNVLQVSLPTNFKAARFAADDDTAILHELAADIEAVRHVVDGSEHELPVKLKVHDSIFVPLAKWSMLLTGNYRCVQADGPRSIREAVHTDLAQSREIYEWVNKLCCKLGAAPDDQVPFEKYARAAEGLSKPSSAARALFAGAPYIERVDLLVQTIARSLNEPTGLIDETVALVDARLAMNRKNAG